MIHQKDLRLGDLVQITVDLPEYKQGDTFVVIDICEIYIGLRSPSESDCRPDMYTVRVHIEGIHLTPEILEKNGWGTKMFGGSKFFCIELNCYLELCVTYEKKDNNFSVGTFSHIPGGDLDINYFPIDIQYVHELQHILWALGEDANLKI